MKMKMERTCIRDSKVGCHENLVVALLSTIILQDTTLGNKRRVTRRKNALKIWLSELEDNSQRLRYLAWKPDIWKESKGKQGNTSGPGLSAAVSRKLSRSWWGSNTKSRICFRADKLHFITQICVSVIGQNTHTQKNKWEMPGPGDFNIATVPPSLQQRGGADEISTPARLVAWIRQFWTLAQVPVFRFNPA